MSDEPLSDVEIVRACAEAMGYAITGTHHGGLPLMTRERGIYDPLRDKAQAVALVERFRLSLNHNCNGHRDSWCAQWFNDDEIDDEIEVSDHDLSRAICTCVARLHLREERGG